MASFTLTVPVEVSANELWSLVSDIPRTAYLFTYLTVEDLTSPAPGHWQYWRQLTIPNVATLRWQELSTVISEGEMQFHAVEGDLETFRGSWQVTPDGISSWLSLTIEYIIPQGVGPNLPGPMATYVMGEIFKTICQRVKEAAEEVYA